ncbi:hypothetical protein [Clostridium sp. OS1-26]|uniref:hypothetical protein n=1 Tax=Clostridium sp. OS1-26 TaxID=3070681 RepID=UPI0027DF4B36|nr:hypothetical protein [Clostridium sp. OS1-26]WML37403.1 hypothetical protein RCG18_12770 [Clostridium sp. OS1-26]
MMIKMLCAIRKFFCTFQPYNAPRLLEEGYSTIYPTTTVNPGANLNCIYSEYGDYRQKYFHAPTKISKSEVDLTNALRMLWEQHIAWTSMTIISIIASLPDVDLVTK